MRVTQSMLSNNTLRNLSSSFSRLGKLQDQLSTGKKINRPSDDPVVAMKGMGYRTDLNRIQQYQRNIGEVKNWIDSTDDALDKGIQALQKIRELVVQGNNGTLEENQRKYIATEVAQLKEHLSNIGDTKVGGKYIFNGLETNQAPSEVGFQDGDIQLEVFQGIKIQVNTSGKALFQDSGLMSDIDKLLNDLNSNNTSSLGDSIASMEKHIDNFITARANIGARQNRVELMEERLSSQEVFSSRILSDNEDIDIEKVIVEMTTQESIHRAALGIGARIMQPTLMDFLR
ncbi:flagellar hook-associated protein FlgL [Peribacillus tepidiphilus]|uniref:flagellar hook-associated protein FlgL n=1 Tax=Peribacillus tepidiphilus TaxID=2652445 RepID=UPI001290DA3E|nr:flagellar hook-associated protein FlgL [Peribacillus tepidiphilus]